jgi:hypothetical protein
VDIVGPLINKRSEMEALGWDVHIVDGLNHTQAMQAANVLPIVRPWLDSKLIRFNKWSSNAHDPCLLENRQKNAVEVSSHSVSVYHLRYHSLIGITMFQVFRPPKFPSPSAVAANK